MLFNQDKLSLLLVIYIQRPKPFIKSIHSSNDEFNQIDSFYDQSQSSSLDGLWQIPEYIENQQMIIQTINQLIFVTIQEKHNRTNSKYAFGSINAEGQIQLQLKNSQEVINIVGVYDIEKYNRIVFNPNQQTDSYLSENLIWLKQPSMKTMQGSYAIEVNNKIYHNIIVSIEVVNNLVSIIIENLDTNQLIYISGQINDLGEILLDQSNKGDDFKIVEDVFQPERGQQDVESMNMIIWSNESKQIRAIYDNYDVVS